MNIAHKHYKDIIFHFKTFKTMKALKEEFKKSVEKYKAEEKRLRLEKAEEMFDKWRDFMTTIDDLHQTDGSFFDEGIVLDLVAENHISQFDPRFSDTETIRCDLFWYINLLIWEERERLKMNLN